MNSFNKHKIKKTPKANKELGQHFLINSEVIELITSDHINHCSTIVEVGPGPAVLTRVIKAKNIGQIPFFAIEKDQRFIENLQESLIKNNIIITDALKYNFDLLPLENTWLVSNLPYNISAPLTIKFIQNLNINYMTLMYQKEVGEKIVPLANKKNSMSSLFALTQTYFNCSRLCLVSPESFSPPPKVNSIVVSFIRIQDPVIPLCEFHLFEKFLRKLFSLKRKQIKKVMKNYYPIDVLDSIFEKLNKTGTERSETFLLEEVHEFYKLLREY